MVELLLKAEGISKEFVPGTPVLRNLDLDLRKGELVVLAGRNGSGKTVFSRILAGLTRADRGTVSFKGVPLQDLRGPIASRIGYAFQEARLQAIGDKVLDDCLFGPMNLGLTRAESKDRALFALGRCGLLTKQDSFVHSLSGGEMRRLSLSGILALDPAVLILDEPFANLDLDGVRSVLQIIIELRAEGRALLVATHELEKILAHADRAIVMDEGRIVLSCGPKELLDRELGTWGLHIPARRGHSLTELSWLAPA